MLENAGKSCAETFIVWSDNINLIGAIIPSGEGKASVCGTIRFKNGESLSFACKQENPEVLHQKLTTVCRQIAKFYRTNLISGKDSSATSLNETSAFLNNLIPLLN